MPSPRNRAIVRTDEYGSYEIWFLDRHGPRWWEVQVYGAVPCYRVRRLRNHCHLEAGFDYYRAKTKMVRRPLAQAVLNLYEKQYDCKGTHRLVMRWNRR